MSDETPPPSLRLRPRARTNETAPPSPVGSQEPPAAPLPTSTPPLDDGAKRFRLKPKLTSETESKQDEAYTSSAPSSPSVALAAQKVASVLPVPVPPPLTPSVPPLTSPSEAAAGEVDGEGFPRLKLKAIVADAAPVNPMETTPAPAGFPLSVPLPPPPLNLPPIPEGASITPRPIVRPRPIVPPPVPSKTVRKKRGLLIGVMVALPVLGGLATFLLMGTNEPEPVPPVRIVRSVVVPPVDPALLADLPTAPGGGAARPHSDGSKPNGTATSDAAAAKAASAAMLALRAWVDGAHISGVVASDTPRAIINGRLVKAGDLIESSQGIIFDGVDLERKEVIFRTKSGLFAGKTY